MERLTRKQSRFVEEYLVDLNASAAARRAGYSERTAFRMGQENVQKHAVKQAIDSAVEERSRRTQITQDMVLQELAAMGFYDLVDIASAPMAGPQDIGKLPESVRRAIVGWGWDRTGNFIPKLADKLSALEKIGKHLGMFTDKIEHIGKIGGGSIKEMSDEELLAIINGN